MKKCVKCEIEKELGEFYKKNDRYHSWCKSCFKQGERIRYAEKVEEKKTLVMDLDVQKRQLIAKNLKPIEVRENWLVAHLNKIDLTLSEYKTIIVANHHKCYSCKVRKVRLYISPYTGKPKCMDCISNGAQSLLHNFYKN